MAASPAKAHVAVLMGGWSVEREVSLRTGAFFVANAEACGYRVTAIDMKPDIAEVLARVKPDVVINGLHGRFGEDGTVQGLLEILRIPYTHSGVLASSLAMRKDRAKIVVAEAGVPVATGVTVSRFEAAKRHVLPPPYVLKPVDEGSSVGVVIVKADRAHPPQEVGRADWPCGEMLLAESFVAGRELTCAVMATGCSASPRSARRRASSTTTMQNTRKAEVSTSAPPRFNQKFTSAFKSWR